MWAAGEGDGKMGEVCMTMKNDFGFDERCNKNLDYFCEMRCVENPFG